MFTPKNIERYKSRYSEPKLQRKLLSVARRAGAKVVYAVLLLYYVLRSDKVSLADKSKIYGALGYFILPTDLILDFIPLLGYSDDMAALVWALRAVMKNLTPAIKAQARAKVVELIPDADFGQIDNLE